MAIIATSHWAAKALRVGEKQSWIQELEHPLLHSSDILFASTMLSTGVSSGISEATFRKAYASATIRFTA
jgi:hypothetical protein